MKKVITALCSIAFAISGITLAVKTSEPSPVFKTLTVSAGNITPIMPPISSVSKDTEKTKIDTVTVQKTDTVFVKKTKVKYVKKVRIKKEKNVEYLPAFALKLPCASRETSHDSIYYANQNKPHSAALIVCCYIVSFALSITTNELQTAMVSLARMKLLGPMICQPSPRVRILKRRDGRHLDVKNLFVLGLASHLALFILK